MAQQFWVHDCACIMMGVEELPLDLRNYLDDIEMYANIAAGSVQSRQVVAVALASYRRFRLVEKGLDYLLEKRREEKLHYDE